MPRMNMREMDSMTLQRLDTHAVEAEKLASNFIDIISDCESLEDFSLRNELQRYSELATWLLNTSFARLMRRRSTDPQMLVKSDKEGVEWEMKVPGTVWTLEPANNGADCCWTIPDFAKCSGDVPLDFVCLKDCDKIFDYMVMDRLRINQKSRLEGFAREGETINQVENRIRHLWMAFYTLHTMILGTRATSDNITKPFHGLLEVMQNDAIISMSGANILGAFDSLGCRLDVLGGDGWVFALHPLIMNALRAVVVADERGNYPNGWSRSGDTLRFKGHGFIEDKLVPIDMENLTGDIWVLDGSAVGAFLGYNIGDEMEIRNDFTEQTKEEGCAQLCTYLYNFGTVASNNANRLMVISNVPVSSACTEIADLASLIVPTTLVPAA